MCPICSGGLFASAKITLFSNKRQKSHYPGSLNSDRELPLVPGACSGPLAWKYLFVDINKLPKSMNILIIDFFDIAHAKMTFTWICWLFVHRLDDSKQTPDNKEYYPGCLIALSCHYIYHCFKNSTI